MIIMVSDNIGGCSLCNKVEKIVRILIDKTKIYDHPQVLPV